MSDDKHTRKFTDAEIEAALRVAVEVAAVVVTERAELEARHGTVWDTVELRRDFEVLGFLAPYVSVTRKIDGVHGTLRFQHSPRYYFSFEAS